ncbi:MAG TPA: pilus assembly PilX N-terminal domain-containing protein, partial [Gemmatimonadales bacterium]|nr:pilus assembly PilX N-terminal domain-containing protein [Gemmatimonadales bacterium]
MARKTGERGVALAMALLVMVLITILLAAGFAAMSSERRVNANDEVALDAFTMAESSMESFMGNRATYGFTAVPPAVIESTRVTQGNGYVDVVLQHVRADTVAGRYGYVLRAHAENQVASLSGTPQGERTVAEYVMWQPAKMTVLAGFTSLSGLQKLGVSGSLSGTDSCGKSTNVAGVAVPTVPGYIGPPGPVSGNPPIQYLGTATQAASATGINWPGPGGPMYP